MKKKRNLTDKPEFTAAMKTVLATVPNVLLAIETFRDKQSRSSQIYTWFIDAFLRTDGMIDDDKREAKVYPAGIEYMVCDGLPGDRSEGHSFGHYTAAQKFLDDAVKFGISKATKLAR